MVSVQIIFFVYFFFQFYLFIFFKILYWFCNTLTWICHGCTCVQNPEPPSHLPPHPISLVHPSVPAPSTLYHALNLDWWFVSHMIICKFHCCSPISSCLCPHPESPKDCSIHLCLFCCLTGLSLTSFWIPYICLSILYWCFSFWHTSPCIISSSIIHLVRSNSNVFFLMAE